MFNFFNKYPVLESFSFLETDMHAHLLPGIDDGAKNIEDSVALIRRLGKMGFKKLYTTPHIMADLYPNTPEIILEKLEEVRTALKAEQVDIEINAAAEYLMDEAFGEKIEAGNLLTLPGNRVLVEMSFISPPPNLDHYIFMLQTKGYKVVIAHPERYMFYRDQFEQYQKFKEKGCELQLNLLSLVAYYGKPIQEVAAKLLKAGWVDYLGTDLHHERQAANLELLLQDPAVSKMLGKYLQGFKNKTLV